MGITGVNKDRGSYNTPMILLLYPADTPAILKPYITQIRTITEPELSYFSISIQFSAFFRS
jgi:hypothetical protein